MRKRRRITKEESVKLFIFSSRILFFFGVEWSGVEDHCPRKKHCRKRERNGGDDEEEVEEVGREEEEEEDGKGVEERDG